MQQSLSWSGFFAVALVTMALTACGGGGDSSPSGTGSSAPSSSAPPPSSPTPSAQAACRPNGNITYSGSAAQVKDNDGKLAVLLFPSMPPEFQLRSFTASAAPASAQVQQPNGAFTTLATSDAATDCVGLRHGKVTDIQGAGSDVAIGRWSEAMDTDGNTYAPYQGVHYAVGTPLPLPVTGPPLACTQLIADTVATVGSTDFGTLVTASATLDPASRSLKNLSLMIQMTGGQQYTLTKAQAPLGGDTTGEGLTIKTVVVGHDVNRPLVAVGYSSSLSGVGGVVVLSCQ